MIRKKYTFCLPFPGLLKHEKKKINRNPQESHLEREEKVEIDENVLICRDISKKTNKGYSRRRNKRTQVGREIKEKPHNLMLY